MFYCLECKEAFEEPSILIEKHGFADGGYEKIAICPNCGETGFEEAFVCNECDAFIPESQSMFNLCEDCESATRSMLKTFLKKLSVDQRNYLWWYIEGMTWEDILDGEAV